MLVTNPDGPEAQSASAATVRRELAEISAAFGKSEGSRRLLNYLVECHLQGKVPRETDVAFDVFRRDASFDGTHDAVVRVAARTLRQKMDEYYREAGQGRPLRFELPRGSYRIVVVPVTQDGIAGTAAGATTRTAATAGTDGLPDMAVDSSGPRPAGADPRAPARMLAPAMWLAAGLAILAAAWLFYSGNRNSASQEVPANLRAVATSPLWQPLLASHRPIIIVLGDLLLFPNPQPEPGRVQLIRDSRINSREQLRDYLARTTGTSPNEDPGTQVANTLVPMGVAHGLVQLLPIASGTGRPVEVSVMDELQVERLRTHDVIFVGPLVSIGPLGDALFKGSGYAFGYDEATRILRNVKTGKEFRPTRGRRENAHDFGLFASFKGPDGNRIMVFTSAGSDLGLLPLVRDLTSAAGLQKVQQLLAGNPVPDEMEALMDVHGYYRTDLSATWVEAGARATP